VFDDVVDHHLLDAARLVRAWREGDRGEVLFLARRLAYRAGAGEPGVVLAAGHLERLVARDGLNGSARNEGALALLLVAVDRVCTPLKVQRQRS